MSTAAGEHARSHAVAGADEGEPLPPPSLAETPAVPPVDLAHDVRVSKPFVAMAWMVFACLLFAIMSLAAKRAMRELSFLEVAAGRAAFGALWIAGWARLRAVSLDVQDKRTQWKRTGAGIAAMFFGFFALSRLPLGDAVTLANLTPLILAVVSQRVLGERNGKGLLVAVVLGLAGVAMIAGASFSHPHGEHVGIAGFVAAVIGACCSAVAMIFLRRLGPRESAEGVSLHFAVWAALATFVVGLPWVRVPSVGAAVALVVAGFSGGAAQVAMTKAYGLDKAARVAAFGYSGLVISQILGVLFLDEVPGLRQVAGAALVILSGLFLVGGALRER
ncbi:MAG: DMT family transporter [Deltaproteobacteria bacterium]|nr:DMT family transporter [Deltaproteobacteria bacterium]